MRLVEVNRWSWKDARGHFNSSSCLVYPFLYLSLTDIEALHPSTKHYFDIWHLARTITKKLLKASKEKGCEVISSWIRGIRKHLYWCATSSRPGFGSLISAKWHSFLLHVANKHKTHPDPLYTECNHGDLQHRKWIKVGNFQFVAPSVL